MLETCNSPDSIALGQLERQVNANPIEQGLPPIPKSYYKHLNETLLESEEGSFQT